ncbi:cyclophane-containing peptide 2OG-Fe(II) oxygenase YhhC [uncultured Enterovirga sp.]|uniref:cyclophane-containing peptide 2OG-Fe(II) oxygenase YhhC n=1 Tax=uncultured Enterovirga sp. TaxID=2026352 RepID=UPI0035CAB1B7
MTLPSFDKVRSSTDPFPHFRVGGILQDDEADRALHWLRTSAPWALRVESFYEQHEFSLITSELGPEIVDLASPEFITSVRSELRRQFDVKDELELVDVGAHRLTSGQTIRIHNDFLEGRESHRMLIQLNDGWTAEQGGLLMLFGDDQPESLRHVVIPTHGSGFAFEISPRSHHAVSSIRDGERYTLVYTFRRPGEVR